MSQIVLHDPYAAAFAAGAPLQVPEEVLPDTFTNSSEKLWRKMSPAIDREFGLSDELVERLNAWRLKTLPCVAAGAWWWHQVVANPPPPVVPEPVRLDRLSLFDADSSELKPGSAKVLINALINIKAQPGWLIVIVGHSDTTGDAEQNLQLSYARARAVRDWMQRMGDIPDNCFAVQGAAGTQPIVSNDAVAGRAANRRVDIRLVPQAGVCGAPSVEVGGAAR